MTLRLHTIIASTRPGRVGPTVANWFHEIAQAHPGFDAHLVDLATFDLPVYDEPKHPVMRDYAHEHTRRWSASVEAADAYVFVTPEYNFGPTPALLNALNYVYTEWTYKPCAFVSYGGVSGGLRAVQVTKQTVTALKMMPIVEAVTVPMVSQLIKDGKFAANDLHRKSAAGLLTELEKWAGALKPIRG
ncbi:NADPH-dependent FMN reductase [Bosea sp. (in: a-proteobacteria)]|uniref:NADPH-dependent FMN reductase n=1 Tax=Bosea sp. (in: a-proteobacteria) TaxID=1871050 RepID=UPI002FCA841F